MIAGSSPKDLKEPRAEFEKCQMLNKWKVVYKRIYSFITLLNPRDKKSFEVKIAEHLLGKSKNFPLHLP